MVLKDEQETAEGVRALQAEGPACEVGLDGVMEGEGVCGSGRSMGYGGG